MSYQFISAFDLDHTLFCTNSSYQFGSYLYKRKLLSFADMVYLVSCYGAHIMDWLTIQNLHDKTFNKLFKGKKAAFFDELVKEFLDIYFDEMLQNEVVRSLHEALEDGHYTTILSSSPDFLVHAIGKRFGVHHCQATTYQVDNNDCFSQIGILMDGETKAVALRGLAQELNIPKKNITAYSDSLADLPFLLTAGTGVAVNPGRKLRRICLENNWKVIAGWAKSGLDFPEK